MAIPPGQDRDRRLSAVPYVYSLLVISLAVWLSVILAAGTFAAILFPEIHKLNPIAPAVAILKDAHWKLIAGYPAQTAFMIARNGGIGLCVISIALSAAWREQKGRVLTVLRWVLHSGAAAALTAFVVLTRTMNSTLEAQRNALFAGNEPVAVELERDFSRLHPISSGLLGTLAVLIFLTLVITVINGATAVRHGPSGPGASHQ